VTTTTGSLDQAAIDGPTVGLAAQVGLLAVLAATVGLGAPGWLAGLGVGLATSVLLSGSMRRRGMRLLGPANRITLARTVLVGGVAALVAQSLRDAVSVPLLIWLTAFALLLDALDGQVARRTGSATALGARFDMEVDAFLILVLSVYLVRPVGLWVVAIGAMRYAFVAAAWRLPWLSAPLPPHLARKAVAAVQGITLVVAATGLLPGPVAVATSGAALALLCWSFGRDVVWLFRRHREEQRRPGPRPAPGAASGDFKVTTTAG
jgi:phosphatidylglycerophosphate synthase